MCSTCNSQQLSLFKIHMYSPTGIIIYSRTKHMLYEHQNTHKLKAMYVGEGGKKVMLTLEALKYAETGRKPWRETAKEQRE